MAENSNPSNSSSSIMYLVIGIAVLLMAAIVPFSMKGKGSAPAAATDEADARIQPVARVELAKAAAKASGPRDGATVYGAVCQACHASGAAGAPKAGDKAAWGPRLALGYDGLVKSAAAGKNAMPPRGGAADLTDDELKRVVAFLANKAGAGFKAPE